MIKSIILTLSVALSSLAIADINGSWQGWGEWKFDGSGARCNYVKFQFVEIEKSLTRTKGFLDCDFVTMEMPELVLEKRADKLFINGEEMGEFQNNHYTWAEIYSENVKIRVEITRDAGHIDYHEIWLDKTIQKPDQTLYEINARVFGGNNKITSF